MKLAAPQAVVEIIPRIASIAARIGIGEYARRKWLCTRVQSESLTRAPGERTSGFLTRRRRGFQGFRDRITAIDHRGAHLYLP